MILWIYIIPQTCEFSHVNSPLNVPQWVQIWTQASLKILCSIDPLYQRDATWFIATSTHHDTFICNIVDNGVYWVNPFASNLFFVFMALQTAVYNQWRSERRTAARGEIESAAFRGWKHTDAVPSFNFRKILTSEKGRKQVNGYFLCLLKPKMPPLGQVSPEAVRPCPPPLPLATSLRIALGSLVFFEKLI